MPRFPGRSRITIPDNNVPAAEHIDFMERAEPLLAQAAVGFAACLREIGMSPIARLTLFRCPISR